MPSLANIKAIEQLVRGRGERYVISITVKSRDHADVYVGDHDLFEVTRLYKVARTDGTWRIENVERRESGW
jgi:hypothetical protein